MFFAGGGGGLERRVWINLEASCGRLLRLLVPCASARPRLRSCARARAHSGVDDPNVAGTLTIRRCTEVQSIGTPLERSRRASEAAARARARARQCPGGSILRACPQSLARKQVLVCARARAQTHFVSRRARARSPGRASTSVPLSARARLSGASVAARRSKPLPEVRY